jgi:hypothetical protein
MRRWWTSPLCALSSLVGLGRRKLVTGRFRQATPARQRGRPQWDRRSDEEEHASVARELSWRGLVPGFHLPWNSGASSSHLLERCIERLDERRQNEDKSSSAHDTGSSCADFLMLPSHACSPQF